MVNGVTVLVVLAEVPQRLRRLAGWLLTRSLLLLIIINVVMFVQQPRITFYPYSEHEALPTQWGLAYEDVALTTEDGVALHGWYIPHPAATKTLLFLHGNGGNISHRGESLAIFHRLGLSILIIDYRGYGRSEGEPGEQGFYRDARAAWHYLTGQHGVKPEQIILFGRSLGGAVATDLASQVTPAALILESTFSSARDMAAHLFPLLSRVVVLRYRFASDEKVAQVTSPILMLHSPQDEVIPYPLGRRLYAAAPSPKQFVEMRGGHNDGIMQSQPLYEWSLQRFISELDK